MAIITDMNVVQQIILYDTQAAINPESVDDQAACFHFIGQYAHTNSDEVHVNPI